MLQQLEKYYKGRKVFVTGHTGFKGSWLIKILQMLGAEVKGYALEPLTSDDIFHYIDGEKICHSVIGDIRDNEKLKEAVITFKPDFIFHLAAQPIVRLSYKIPTETFEVNAIGTANVLDAMRQLERKCYAVLITTDKVYHNNEWIYPYRENDRLGGYDPYSASKACSEIIIDCYRNSYFNINEYSRHQKAIAVARAGNVIGGGDWNKDRLVPDIVRALMFETPVIVRNPNAVRPWQHVLEPLVGYLQLGIKLVEDPINFSQAFNFGPYANDALSVQQVVKIAIESWGSGSFKTENSIGQPHEAKLLSLDINKAITCLNWRPKIDASDAIKISVDWYKKYVYKRKEIKVFTEHQIANFLKV